MHFDSSASHNMTQNDALNLPMDMGDRNTIFDEMLSHLTPVSPAQTNAFQRNNHQKLIMAEFPALSMLEGEPMNNLYAGFNISNHVGLLDCDASVIRNAAHGRNTISNPSCPLSNTPVHERFMGGMPISSALASRCGPQDAYPLEILRTTASNDYSDAINSAFATSLNCEYDGILSADKFLACQFMGNMNPNGWISSENSTMGPTNPSCSSKYHNELSLSLATSQPSIIQGANVRDQCSEMSCSRVTNHSLNEKQLGSETSCISKNLSLSFGSRRPVQLPQFVSGSGYLRVIQEILAEIASYSLENVVHTNYAAGGIGPGGKFSFSSSRHAERGLEAVDSDDFPNDNARFELQMDLVEAKKKKLLDLLQMVDEQYNQCLDEIHTVISAFHAATELDPHVHARFALQTISSLYKNLRERISSQILKMGAFCTKGHIREEDGSFETSFIKKRWALQQLQRKDHQLWRPQRGLPERSVSVLRAWMFQNFLHPYPKDAEKHLLAVKSGLTRSQVSNWFINARVRLWKPMIEEMYTEMNRRNCRRNDEETDHSNHRNHMSIQRQRFDMS